MEDFKLGNWLAEGGNSRLRSFSLSKSYSRISWVFTCVGAIESSISGVPLLFSRHGEVIEDKSDPVLNLFSRPNPPDVPSFRSLLSQTFILLGIDGILFWVFKREKGVWTTVSIKKKWQMRPVFKSGSDSSLLGWVELDKYRQRKATYGYREVLPIRYYNPYDPLSGMAPLTAARLGIEQEFNMSAWNAAFFARGLRNPIGIKFKRTLLPKQRKDLEKNTRDYFSGIEGGQGVFILEGDGEFADLHLSSTKDLDFVDGKQLTREEICAVYGVPPAVVGIFRYANYANSGIQRTLFWENCLLPKMATLLDLVQTNVLDEEFPGVTAAWDKRGISALQKGFKAVSAAAKTYFDIGYTRSEIAYILDVPELDPPRNESDTELDIPEEEESRLIIDISKALVPCKTDLDIITIKADEPWWFEYGSAYIQVLTSLENRWLTYLKRYFAELSKSLYKKALRRETPLLNPLVWEASWEGMAELLIGDTCELAAKLTIAELNTAGNLDLILRVIQNTLAKASAVDAIDISKYFTSDELAAFQKAISSYASKTVGVSGEIISELNKRAAQELLTGMTPAQLRKVVGTIVEETYRSRSLTIARTISGGAYNSARFESFQILDVQKHKWINSGDGNVRMTHLQEGGSAPVIVGEPFPVTGCRYPLDPMGKAKEVINCISDPQQPIWTVNGWKPIGKIKVNDLVLTHKGRYRSVTAVSHGREYDGPLVKVKPLGDVKAIPCTLEHRFLTDTGWKEAQYLSTEDKLLVQAKPCPNCGQLMPWWRQVCSFRCNSLAITKRQWNSPEHQRNMSKKATAQLDREYADGTRDRFAITKAGRSACQDKYGEGGYLGTVRNTKEFQQKIVDGVISKHGSYLNMHKQMKISAQSPVEAYWLDWAERHFATHLDTQFWVGDYRVDGYIKDQKLFVEIDAYDRKDEVERDTAILLQHPDHSILHLKVHGHTLQEQYTRDLMQCNHDGGHQFVSVAIKAVKSFTPKRTVHLYNFAVEDDESYIIKGIVSHNCRCTTFPIKHKAPGRTRPVTVPEKPAMTPMVGMGKDQVMKNFFDKMRKHPGLVRRGRYLKVPVKAVKEVEAIADDLLDSDFFKPLQLTDAQVEARVKLYGSRIKVDLPKLDSAGQDELKKYLLGFIDEDTLKAGKVKKVRVCVNDKVPTAVYDVNANRISLSTSMEDRLSLVFNELGKGGNPARKMAPFEDLYLDDLRNLAHEFGHHLHENSKVALDWSKDFFAVRTKKDKFITLRGGAKVKKDKWTSHYQGRVYPEEGSIGGGLELVSMYTAEISALPWTPAMRELLKNPRIRKVWAQTVLANFLGDPDGFEAALKLLGSL